MATTQMAARSRAESDPFSRVLQPVAGETPQARQARLEQEALAQKISDAIDEQLRKEKADKSKRRQEVRILLLGQSESGKSTTLKQFQLLYAPSSFQQEAPAWRPIVYLNLVRSIRRILEIITLAELEYVDDDQLSINSSSSPRRPSFNLSQLNLNEEDQIAFGNIRAHLSPLLSLEDRLIVLLSHPDEESGEATHLDFSNINVNPQNAMIGGGPSSSNRKEVGVGGGWKKALGRFGGKKNREEDRGFGGEMVNWTLDPNDPIHVLQRCTPDMEALWNDERVREILRVRRVRLEDNPGFYLNDIRRVTAPDYIPTIDDVLKARLKTLGVVEHRFSLDSPAGNLFGKSNANAHAHLDWLIYDVGGARNQRHVWAPFFDDVQALIFLAPISAFDQVLAEDARVNRMEDSLLLWKSIVSNKLLRNVNLVLFLNKIDLLHQKLASGTQLRTYMTSYGDRPNDFESIVKYFRNKFGAMHQSFTPNSQREVYIHLTSVVDTQATKKIITSVRDMLLKDALKGTNLL